MKGLVAAALLLPALAIGQVAPPPPPPPPAPPIAAGAAQPSVDSRPVQPTPPPPAPPPPPAVSPVTGATAAPLATPPPPLAPPPPPAANPAPMPAPLAPPPAPPPPPPAAMPAPLPASTAAPAPAAITPLPPAPPAAAPLTPAAASLPYVEPRDAEAPPAVSASPANPTTTPPPPPVANVDAAPTPGATPGAAAPPPPPPLAGPGDAATAAGSSSSAAGGEPVPPPPPAVESATTFVKGELTNIGVDRLITKRSRVIVSAGSNYIAQTLFLLVNPQLGLRFGDFALGLGVPLNIEMVNFGYPKDPGLNDNHIIGVKQMGTIRQQDWRTWNDYARILTYLSYGNKEDKFYLNVGQQHASTIGHGALMRRYNGNIDINTYRAGAQIDFYGDYAGVELMTNDVTRWNIMSGLLFVKPLSFFLDDWMAKSVSVGVHAAVDRQAPMSIIIDKAREPTCKNGSGQIIPCPFPANLPKVGDDNYLEATRGSVVAGGLDIEMKLLKTDNADIKPYIDYSRFLSVDLPNGQPGGGLTFGILGRFNVGADPVNAFRLIAELRHLEEGFRAGYFDTFYEVDKFLMMGTGGVKSGSGQIPHTKAEYTFGDLRPEGRWGYYAEASWGIREAIGLTFALEGEGGSQGKNFIAHLEIPAMSWLQLFGTLYVRGFQEWGAITALDQHSIAFAGVRLKPLPIAFINFRAFKSFELDAYNGKDGPLGTLQYQNSVGYAGDLGFGWEF